MKLEWVTEVDDQDMVAPFAGAWIETCISSGYRPYLQSLPSRERGLKLYVADNIVFAFLVAPFAGAWIETGTKITAV